MKNSKVKDFTKTELVTISPEGSIKEAALKMEQMNCGVLPVGTKEKPIGVITDRDIAIRAVAKGKDADKTKVSEIMTKSVYFISEDATLEQAADEMRKRKVGRLIVNDNNGHVKGILSLGDCLRNVEDPEEICCIVEHVSNSKKRAA